MKLEVYGSSEEVLRAVSGRLLEEMKLHRIPFHLALSGAGTARKLYQIWASEFRNQIHWEQLRFYWVDERCVKPQDEESNYKYAYDLLFRPLNIPAEYIHRIRGEEKPEIEAEHYSEMVRRELPECSCLPQFDCVILGIGEDGHTASIFSQNLDLLIDKRCYAVSQHPVTGQKRITMTGPLILNSKLILIPVLGTEKAMILHEIFYSSEAALPAAYILSRASEAFVFTDSQISVK